MNSNDMDDERAAFIVHWCKDVPEAYREDAKRNVRAYLQESAASDRLADAWEAWKARAALSASTEATLAPQPVAQPVEQTLSCWSCEMHYTKTQRSHADGHCPHCGVEIEEEESVAQPVEQTRALTDGDLAKIWAQADDTSDERGAIAYARSVLVASKADDAVRFEKAMELGLLRTEDIMEIERTLDNAARPASGGTE